MMTTLLLYRSSGALAEFKAILEKAKKSRRFVSSHGRHLTASGRSSSSPLLICVPTEMDIFGHSCDVVRWKPFEDCFDPISLNVLISRGSARALRTLLVKNIAEREAEITNLPWTQTEKDNALARCRVGQRAWRAKKTVLCLNVVTDEDGNPLENEDESGRRLSEYWRTIFQARVEGPIHHQYEDMLRYVQCPTGS